MSVYVTTALRLLDAPTMHSMRSRVYVTDGRPSVRPSVRPIDQQQQRRPAGLLLSAGGVCSRYRPIACTLAANAPSVTFRVEGRGSTLTCFISNSNRQNSLFYIVFYEKGRLGSRVVSVLDSGAEGPGFKSQSRRCRCLRQTVHTYRASVHQAAKLVAALLRLAGVTQGLWKVLPAYRWVYASHHMQAD